MLSKILNVALNHKKKLTFFALVFGAYKLSTSAFVQKYAIEWYHKKYLEKYEKKELYLFMNQTCAETIIRFQVHLFQKIAEIFDTTELEECYERAKNKQEKLLIWNQLRILVLSKITANVFANVVFILGLTVHFSILSAFKTQKQDIGGTHLSCILNYIENSVKLICDFVKAKVTPIVAPIGMTSLYSFQTLEILFYNIQTALCIDSNNPLQHIGEYVYGTNMLETDTIYKEIAKDSKVVLYSEQIISIGTSLVNKSFNHIMTILTQDPEFAEMSTGLPLVCVLSKLSSGLTSEHFKSTINLPSEKQMECIAANVFEAYCT